MTWKDVIGDERERHLLELAVKLTLDTRAEWLDLFDDASWPDPDKFEAMVMWAVRLGRDECIAGYGPADFDSLSSHLLLLTPDQWHQMLTDMLALSWKDVIGDEREHRLLELLVDIILDCWFGGIQDHLGLAGDGPEGIDPDKFQKAVRQEFDPDWEGGHLVEQGYTLTAGRRPPRPRANPPGILPVPAAKEQSLNLLKVMLNGPHAMPSPLSLMPFIILVPPAGPPRLVGGDTSLSFGFGDMTARRNLIQRWAKLCRTPHVLGRFLWSGLVLAWGFFLSSVGWPGSHRLHLSPANGHTVRSE
jgi:hypothetical protein